MNKINKYLSSIGLETIYKKYYTGRHYNGASFYNDGTFGMDVYQIGDTDYFIHTKVTGRPAFYLYKNKNVVTIRYSQAEFVKLLEKTDLKNKGKVE